MKCKNCDCEITEEETQKRVNNHDNKNYCDLCIAGYNYKLKAVRKYNKENETHCGNNLEIMEHIKENSVDLIYLDPPYFTQTNWKIGNNEFSDSWKDMDEYLNFMEDRLRQMHRILKDTGSIYLHVDHHAVYELKVVMDKIFGRENFINDIVWCYSGGGVPKTAFARKHDTILFYTKTDKYNFNIQYTAYKNPNGTHSGGKPYREEGKVMDDWWSDIPVVSSSSNKRLGYPTQKPIELLTRIIKASSNKNDIVLDPFCGSGSTQEAAKIIGRKYIGIDQNKDAVKMSKKRLKNIFKQVDFDDC